MEKIIRYIEFGDDILDKVKEIAQIEKALNPLIIVGTTNNIPVCYYLSLFDIAYHFESFTTCFDAIFKSYFVFNIPFPPEVNNIYIFIQHYVYMIYTTKDKLVNKVLKYINTLDSSRLPSNDKPN